MIRASHLRRLFLFSILIGLGFVGLGFRLYVLQVVRHEKYRDIVGDNTQRVFVKPPQRGDILDANGHQLAVSLPVKRLLADPGLIHPHQAAVARALAPILSLDESNLVYALRLLRTNELGVVRTNRFVDLKYRATHEQWGQITQAMAQLRFDVEEARLSRKEKGLLQAVRRRGVYAEDDYQRVYQSGHLASHVLGYVLEVEKVVTNSTVRMATAEMTGVYGIEQWLDRKLKGTRGWRVTEQDRQQREIVVFRGQDVEARPGDSAVLTLDMFIQGILEGQLAEAARRFNPKSVCGMVVRPQTGEILAMASLPDFDPNLPWQFSDDARRNRAISDFHEPGSTFKIVVVSGALDADMVTLNDTFFCENGRWQFKGKTLHDHDHGYANLTVEGIITHSSNIGAAKIAVNHLGAERLYDYIHRFGFGERSGITLDGESPGMLHPVQKWDGMAISRIPMGHAIGATHLQMVMAMSAIANEGRLMRPMLIQGLKNQAGEWTARYQPQFVRQVVNPRAARDMVKALKTVTAREGTAPKAALDHHVVAGKTGTAQVPGVGGYLAGKYISSFVGFFPADNPEICISVLVEEPELKKGYYGGTTAAPYFKAIGEQVANYLKIKPDNFDALAGATNALPAAGMAARIP